MSAAIPSSVVQNTGRSSSTEARGTMSHGRGGAGNMGTTSSDFDRPSLDTPTIKSDVYTTGRGGSGNMAKNDDPEAARRAQDVVGHPRRESNNSTHVGRGGAANVFSPAVIAEMKKNSANNESAIDSKSQDGEKTKATADQRKTEKGWADRSKDWLMKKLRKSGPSTTNTGGGGVIQGGQSGLVNNSGESVTQGGTLGVVHSSNEGPGESAAGGDDSGKSATIGGVFSEVGDHHAGEETVSGLVAGKSVTSEGTLDEGSDEGVYQGSRRLPLSTDLDVLNENRVCGGVFDDNREYDMSHITVHDTTTPATPNATHDLLLRKGLYASRFKSSFSLRERLSIANLRGKAKVEENVKDGSDVEEDDDEEVKAPKKNKLGMRLTFGKSTFF